MEDDSLDGFQMSNITMPGVGLLGNNYSVQTVSQGKVEQSETLQFQNTSTCNNQSAVFGGLVKTMSSPFGTVGAPVSCVANSTSDTPSQISSDGMNLVPVSSHSSMHSSMDLNDTVQLQYQTNSTQDRGDAEQQQMDTSVMNGIQEDGTVNQNYDSYVVSQNHIATHSEEHLCFNDTPGDPPISRIFTTQPAEVNSTHMSVIDPNCLSEIYSSSQNPDSRSMTPSDYPVHAQSVMSFGSQNFPPDSEHSQDSLAPMTSAQYGHPRGSLNFSHLLQAAGASPFSDQLESPMSSDAADGGEGRWQSTPEPELPGGHRQKAGPRRKKTWLIDDDEDPSKEPLNSELRNGLRILKEIMSDNNKSVNWPFMDPVNRNEVPEYYDRIDRPMWLRRMREKFDRREYKTITEFVADFRVMLENCYRFNGPDHLVSRRGQRLETVLEQKLNLLSRELREKTSLSATSGKPVLEKQLFSGSRRRKALVPHDSTALLQQLRLEAQEKVKEHRKMQVQERKTAHEQFVKELDDWEDKLYPTLELRREMRSMWEIPQIGHFLFLCLCKYDLGEVAHWELERSFLIPRESVTMQRVMTSLLSTPYQRTQVEKKPPMPYRVWSEKLRKKVESWYQTLRGAQGDVTKVCAKLGLDEKFFKVVGMSNPMTKKWYHELSVYQRVWIMKGLCDYCLEQQDNLREAIEAADPPEDQNCYVCGTDGDGYRYIHFPQFCGNDVRIYRQAPFKYPKLHIPPPETPKGRGKRKFKVPSPKKKQQRRGEKRDRTPEPATPRSRDRRLRQNPRQASTTPNTSDCESAPEDDEYEDSDNNNSEMSEEVRDIEEEEPPRKSARSRARRTAPSSRESTPSTTRSGRRTGRTTRDSTPSVSRSQTPTKLGRRGVLAASSGVSSRSATPTKLTRAMLKKAEGFGIDLSDDLHLPADFGRRIRNSDKKEEKKKEEEESKDGETKEEETPQEEEMEEADIKTETEEPKEIPSVVNGEVEMEEEEESPKVSSPFQSYVDKEKDQVDIKEEVDAEVQQKDQTDKVTDSTNEASTSKEEEMEIDIKKEPGTEQEIKEEKETDDSPGEKGVEEGTVQEVKEEGNEVMEEGNDTEVKEERNDDTNSTSDVKTEPTENPEATIEEPVEVQPEILGPDLDEFELVVDCVDSLKTLAQKFEEQEIPAYGKKPARLILRKKCEKDLHDRLLFLIKELEPWEVKLAAAYKKMRIKLRKEHEAYVEPPEVPGYWDSEESASESGESAQVKETDEEEEEAQEEVKEEARGGTDDSPKLSDLLIPGVSTRSGRKRPALMSKDVPPAKKQATETATTSGETKPGAPILSLRNPLVIRGPDDKTEVLPNLDPNHPALKNATLFAQLPNGTTVAVSLASVIGANNPQQQGVMKALLSSGKLSIATSAQTHWVIGQKQGNSTSAPSTTTQVTASSSTSRMSVPTTVASASQLVVRPQTTKALPVATTAPKVVAVPPKTIPKAETITTPTETLQTIEAVKEEPSSSSPTPSSQAQSVEGSNPQSEYFHYNSLDKLPPNVIHQLLKTQPQRLKDIQSGDPVSPAPQQKPIKPATKDEPQPSPSSALPTSVSTSVMSPSKTPKYATNVTVKALLESRAAAATKPIDSPAPKPPAITKSPKIQLVAKPQIAPRLPVSKPVQYVLTNTRNIAPRPQGLVVGSNIPRIVSPQSLQVIGSSAGQSIRASVVPQQLQFTTPQPQSVVQVVSGGQQGLKFQGQGMQTGGLVQVQGQTLQLQTPQIVASQAQGQVIQGQGQIIQSQGQVIKSQGQVLPGQVIKSQGQVIQSQGQIIKSQGQVLPGQVIKSQGQVIKSQGQVIQGQSHIIKTQGQPVQGSVTPMQQEQNPDAQVVILPENPQAASNTPPVPSQPPVVPSTISVATPVSASQLQAAMALQQLSQCQASTASTSTTLEDLQAGEALAQLASQAAFMSPAVSSSPSTVTSASLIASMPSVMVTGTSTPSADDGPRLAVSVIGTNNVHQVPQSAATVLKVTGGGHQPGQPLAVNAAHLQALIAKTQDDIGAAVKTVITEVPPTSLPTAQFKVSSPFTSGSRHNRPVTITAPSSKVPISAVPKLAVRKKSPEKTIVPTTTATTGSASASGGQSSPMKQPAMSMSSPPPPNKPLVLKVTPTTLQTKQGLVQGIIIPAGISLSPQVLQQLIGQKGQTMVVLQQSKDNSLHVIHSPPGVNLSMPSSAPVKTPPAASGGAKAVVGGAKTQVGGATGGKVIVGGAAGVSTGEVAVGGTLGGASFASGVIGGGKVQVGGASSVGGVSGGGKVQVGGAASSVGGVIGGGKVQVGGASSVGGVIGAGKMQVGGVSSVGGVTAGGKLQVGGARAMVGGASVGSGMTGAALVSGTGIVARHSTVLGTNTTSGKTLVVGSSVGSTVNNRPTPTVLSPKLAPQPVKPAQIQMSQLPVSSQPAPLPKISSVTRLVSPPPAPRPATLTSPLSTTNTAMLQSVHQQASTVKTISSNQPANLQAATKVVSKLPTVSAPQQQKLVLLNVNGQLLTQQGVAVTLQGGVLKQLVPAAAQVHVSSPKLVMNPSSSSASRTPVSTPRAVGVQNMATSRVGQVISQAPTSQVPSVQLSTATLPIQGQLQQQQGVNINQQIRLPAGMVPMSGTLPQTVSLGQAIRLQQPLSVEQSQQLQGVKLQTTPQQVQVPQLQQVRIQQQGMPIAQLQAPKAALGPQIQVALPPGLRFPTAASNVSYQPVQVQTGAGLVLQAATQGLVQLPSGGLIALPGGIQQQQQQPQVIVQQPQVISAAAVSSTK